VLRLLLVFLVGGFCFAPKPFGAVSAAVTELWVQHLCTQPEFEPEGIEAAARAVGGSGGFMPNEDRYTWIIPAPQGAPAGFILSLRREQIGERRYIICEFMFVGDVWDERALHSAPGAWRRAAAPLGNSEVWGQWRSTTYELRHPPLGVLAVNIRSGGGQAAGPQAASPLRMHVLGIYRDVQ